MKRNNNKSIFNLILKTPKKRITVPVEEFDDGRGLAGHAVGQTEVKVVKSSGRVDINPKTRLVNFSSLKFMTKFFCDVSTA